MSQISRILKKSEQIEVQNTIINLMETQGKNALVNVNVFNKQKGSIQEPFLMVIQSAEHLLVQRLNKSEYQVFGFMRSLSQWNNQINIDIKVIAASIGMSDRTVKSAISKLEELNVIKIIKSPLDARRNIYEINPQSSWKGSAEEYKKIMNRFGYEPKGLKKGTNQLVLELKPDKE
jgi:DNA-binding MarR family transcriptional regulator